mgnify:CR=1 FL=1
MDFYTQTMVELILALGAAMVLGNLLAILKRNKDKKIAQESLKTSPRTSKQTNSAMLKNQVSQGKATLAIAPLKRSIVFIVIGLIAFTWATITLLAS